MCQYNIAKNRTLILFYCIACGQTIGLDKNIRNGSGRILALNESGHHLHECPAHTRRTKVLTTLQKNNDGIRHTCLCETLERYTQATKTVPAPVGPKAFCYVDLCDDCAKEKSLTKEELSEYDECVAGFYRNLWSAEDTVNWVCECDHVKPRHRLTSCTGRDEDGNPCICRAFSP
jgi:hypothetical protein